MKDEQDFNVNQLIKHRNDLKFKMEKIKEDMENGLIDDKEKLKSLAMTGSRVYKVKKYIKCLNFMCAKIKKKLLQRLQSHLKQGKIIIQLVRLCDNLELDHHHKTNDFFGRKKKFLSFSEEELKQPPQIDDVRSAIKNQINNQ